MNLANKPPLAPMAHAPGHYYSPIVAPEQATVTAKPYRAIPSDQGIALDAQAMAEFLARTMDRIKSMGIRFPEEKTDGTRFFLKNVMFGFADASAFSGMILEHKPKRIIEVGSGHSSAIMLDTISAMNYQPTITFIEPYADRLRSILTEQDHGHVTILELPIQSVDPGIFDELESGDILFFDTTHIVKTGSDVLHEVFCILPRLKPGVVIHFHDIFDRFEYPETWIAQGRNWNEQYFLRAFLTDNANYEVVFFVDYLTKNNPKAVLTSVPAGQRYSGGSLWLRKKKSSVSR